MSQIQHHKDTGYCIVSFDSDDDRDEALYELTYNSSGNVSGIGLREFMISKEQCDLLTSKNIKYQHINKN
jgi:hypothetical protein